jgi:tRNA pseudouridine(55) synthase
MTTKQIIGQGVFGAHKRSGETPLQCLDRLRLEHPELKNETLSYAGRLDPLASGLLLVMVGKEANQNRNEYLGLDKIYEVEVMFGVATDSYDVLGSITETKPYDPSIIETKAKEIIKDRSIFSEMEYPPYSSKPVNGKSLFQWAREGRLGEIEIPKQKGKILNLEILKSDVVSAAEFEKHVYGMIDSVIGNFRQDEIRAKWKEYFDKKDMKEFLIMKLKVRCQSGVYMRSIAHVLGQAVGVPALACSILRTNVGTFDVDSAAE